MDDQTKPENDGFEWAICEIFGHIRHVGRAREEERFGQKMLRIDVPTVETGADPGTAPLVTWRTHWYGGAAIFSFSLTDEDSVMRAAGRRWPPARVTHRGPDYERGKDPHDSAGAGDLIREILDEDEEARWHLTKEEALRESAWDRSAKESLG